ncbi:MAG: choice-of-anchor L domain-containing protein, partial [Aequorivita sp.]|nr:choice-of-anchor L domain-containing protein [Aequorivita sp.]
MFKIITKLFTSDKRFLIGLFLILSFSFYGQEITKERVGYSPDKSINTRGPGTGNSILVPNNDAQYGSTPKELVENILASSCLTIGDVRFGYYRKDNNNWSNNFGAVTLDRQLGYFNDGTAQNFAIDEGLLLSTGKIRNAMGPSVSGSFSDRMVSNAGDPDLRLITGRTMYDAAVLEINFTPVGTKIEFQFVFASDEYLEYCGTQYEDAFGFFLSGPGIAGGQGYQNNAVNLAKLPNGDPITINTIHPFVASNINGNAVPASNPAYYANNNINVSTEFDGGTVILTASYTGLISGQQYKMKMAIADASDQRWDAGVFLKAKSFTSNALVVNNPAPLCIGTTTDLTAPEVTAGSSLPGPYTYWRNEAATIPYETPTAATAGTYYIKAVDVESGCIIIKPVIVTNSNLDSSFTKIDVTCFGGNNGSINLSVTGGSGTYTYIWSTNNGSGLTQGVQDQSGLSAGTYNVTINDGTCETQETVVITQPNQITVDAGDYGPLCDNVSPITLTGTPTNSNGTWSGTGVTDNGDGTASFDPTGLSGSVTVTYSYTDGSSCSNSDTADILVNTAPTVDAGDYGPLCDNVSPI